MKNSPAFRRAGLLIAQAGFSLVELLLTIALMAILMGAGTTMSLRNSQRKQVDQAGRDFQGVLEQARANALAGKKANCLANQRLAGWGVSIPVGGTSYTLDEWCGGLYGGVPRNKLIFTTKNLPTGVTINIPNVFPIIFKPQGQGIWTGVASGFPSRVRVTASGFGFTKNIDLYRSGQISAP